VGPEPEEEEVDEALLDAELDELEAGIGGRQVSPRYKAAVRLCRQFT